LTDIKTKAGLLVAGGLAIVFAIPALGQQGPESLLPEGFGDPAPPPAPPASRPPVNGPIAPGSGTSPIPSSTVPIVPGADNAADEGDDEDDDDDDDDDEEELVIKYDVPPTARRSLSAIGIISPASGGFPTDAFGMIDGMFLKQVAARTTGPLASRWGSIMTRRLLASRTNTPVGVNGADWTAERAWLLLRMGDSVVARQLVQSVDAGNYTKRLLQVSMQAFLANGDLSGICPLTESGVRLVNDDGRWKMSRAICASMSGEQGSATAFINQGRYQGWVRGVDYRLTEKAVGAGINGRRSVKIEWEGVEGMNPWRFGLASATGLEPPERLFADSGRQIAGWRAQLPMFTPDIRAKYAFGAAALGVLSNRDMVDLYAQILENPDAPESLRARAEGLGAAYTGSGDAARVGAMSAIWTGAAGADYHGALVMTARAAALIRPDDAHSNSADQLIASMLTAGLDSSAARWSGIVPNGSLGWALIAVGSPRQSGQVAYGSLDDFYGNDSSQNAHKSALLLAGLAGLGRVDAGAQADFAGDLKVNVARQTAWSKAIMAAAERGEQGTVALMAAAGLQAPSWSLVPANHLYYIVRALRKVGLDAEARMIAAEAVTFG
jgi:hypothetical protein